MIATAMRFEPTPAPRRAAPRSMLLARGMTQFEVGALVNLMPESAEESKCLVPSLEQAREGRACVYAASLVEEGRASFAGRAFS